ncbi:sensor histidine kinase [Marivita hallyeonensis]|uniref:histidine kinase n=1 Tax=Marivita hallyeonensis TaxID=996342 RepID=A0A1M5RVD9_9RHOB|nr:sensor histidine kinase [Marivita hallyeonensis]SHH30121.1 two-component system, OmpR family, sensor histidine kinase TctE [Marivita hallyeonensis]
MTLSLRLRLTLIILLPLLAIGTAVGFWQVSNARATAADLFDRSLLSAALAISADVERTNGNAISLETSDILADTSGGPVFYHVYAPDGIYVLGYATPPVPSSGTYAPEAEVIYYDGRYHSREVRVLRYRSETTIDGVSGLFTYTVWQDVAVRNAFVSDLVLRTFTVIAVLIGSVALVVWFGVSLGLRPLLALEDAISRRSSDDLRPIKRAVPPETVGLVTRLNSLFRQVEQAMETQSTLISNAAHQLRNPIAGVLAMAEAVHSAPTDAAARERSTEVLEAARRASALANKLLTLERVQAAPPQALQSEVDVTELVTETVKAFQSLVETRGVELVSRVPDSAATVVADRVMLGEALANLIDNAVQHGGPELTRIAVSLASKGDHLEITVQDNGKGLAASDVSTALARFGQAGPSDGSGLGLSIAHAVALRHDGSLDLQTDGQGLTVVLRLPLAHAATKT